MQGRIFNVERYSLHNGPGTRTTIFLKGCPLRCAWCGNPESQRSSDDLMVNAALCLSECDECLSRCPVSALHKDQFQKIVIERERCTRCGQCAPVCPTEALLQIGQTMRVEEALCKLCKDRPFYETSGGGVTVSGGEPLGQADFTRELLKACKENDLHTALDTSGYGQWRDLEMIVEYTDLVLYDLKFIDSKKHQQYTGVSNERILKNLRHLAKNTHPDMIVRVPCIPGINDSEEDLEQLFHFLESIALRRIDILPYHRLGNHKYSMLGQRYPLETIPIAAKEESHALKTLMLTRGFSAEVII